MNPDWELLNSQSTCNLFCNKHLLKYIQRVPHSIKVHSQAGTSRTNLVALKEGHGLVWFDPNSIAHIYFMKLMTKRYRITFDSCGNGTHKNALIVHRPDSDMRFGTDNSGLYYRDAGTATAAVALATAAERDVVWNTADATEGMTLTDLKKADTAHRVQQIMAFPSNMDYDGMVRGYMLQDCSVATHTITNATSIFGSNLHEILGKTARQSPQLATTHYIDIP